MANLLQTVTRQYNKLYQPQINVKKQQLAGLNGAFDAQKTALNQAKVNAFRGFDANAAGRNVFYSGYRPEAQAEYIGQTYTPELAKIGTAEATQRLGLLEELNKLLIQQGQDVFGRVDTLQNRAQERELSKMQLAQERRLSNAEIAAMMKQAKIGLS